MLNRTNARMPIFTKDEDYIAFETVLEEAVARTRGQKGVRNRLLWMERLLGNLGSWEDQNDQLPGGGFIMC
jgi:hypothetical protein